MLMVRSSVNLYKILDGSLHRPNVDVDATYIVLDTMPEMNASRAIFEMIEELNVKRLY